MDPHQRTIERHKIGNAGRLRAAVLGANDGIVSTASLVLGVAASQSSHRSILIAGVAGLVAGAMSMATGEYVSVQSQADAEKAALAAEQDALCSAPGREVLALAKIYQARGLAQELAGQVARALTQHDALAAHARDELGISVLMRARPLQAAIASALCFSLGAALPLTVLVWAPLRLMQPAIALTSLLCLATLGALAARAGGAAPGPGAMRVAGWSALSMAVAAGVGMAFGAAGQAG